MSDDSPTTLFTKFTSRRLLQIAGAVCVLVIAVILYAGVQFNNLVADKFEGQLWKLPNVVYGRRLELSPGSKLDQQTLLDELKQLNYRKTKQPTSSGEYSVSGQTVQLIRRPFNFPEGEQPAMQVSIRFSRAGVEKITDVGTGHDVGVLYIEPRILGMLDGDSTEKRIYMPKDEMPETLISALLATEDRNFYEHEGVSLTGIARAFAANLKAGRRVQGGSTLTQQLAKNLFLTREKSLTRKIKEAYLAVIMDYRYSKDQLLDAYLNQVYLGQNGKDAVHGFALAARFYFGQPLTELKLDQQALLVGMVKGPSYYNPWRYPERAKARRDLVLKMMVDSGDLETADYQRAINKPLSLRAKTQKLALQPAYFDYVKESLKEQDIDYNSGRGLRLFTTFDPKIQGEAEAAVYNTMPKLEKKSGQSLQTAMVVADKDTGAVRAMIGSRQPEFHGFNRALHAKRQIGSLVKPAVYLTALSQPQSYTLATNLTDKPVTIKGEHGEDWSPRNYDRKYRGQVPLYQALAHSYNVPTVNLGMAIGLDKVTDTLVSLGVKRDEVPQLPSMLLGAFTLSPLEVTQMYQTLGNQGQQQTLFALTAVMDEEDQVLYLHQPAESEPLDQQAVWLTEYAMAQVVKQGTARYLNQVVRPDTRLAGKTGTSDQGRDSWYAGIDGRQVVTIWVGRDDNNAVALTGSSGPLRIYGDYISRNGYQSLKETQPEQITTVSYTAQAGRGLSPSCFGEQSLPVWDADGNSAPSCMQPLEEGVKKLGQGIAKTPERVGGFFKRLFKF